MGQHVEIQFDAQVETVRRLIERQRQGTLSQKSVQVLEQARVETPGQGVPRQPTHLGEGAQAHARQGCGRARRQAETLHGHAPQGLAQLLQVGHRQPVVGIGQHPGRRRIRRADDAVAKTQLVQFLAQARLQLRPGAEQAQARLDLEHQGARVMHADLGTEAVSPGREKLLPAGDFLGVVFGAGEVLAQGLGGGQRLPGAQPQLAARGIHRLDHPALRRPAEQRQRGLRFGALAQRRVQRQLREQNTDPAHGNLRAPGRRRSAPNGPGRRGT